MRTFDPLRKGSPAEDAEAGRDLSLGMQPSEEGERRALVVADGHIDAARAVSSAVERLGAVRLRAQARSLSPLHPQRVQSVSKRAPGSRPVPW